MGNKISTMSTISLNLYNFEKVQNAIKNNDIIINTLSDNEQDCLIAGTTNIKEEVTILNDCLKNKKDALIIIYGYDNFSTTSKQIDILKYR
jgi:uncharacterized protein YjgD (DUF1641 family)